MPPSSAPPRVLIAGIGNIFLGDDAFGVEVARRLAHESLPDGVRVIDIGLRSLHLAYELASGCYDAVILVDALSRGEPPGTLSVLEPDSAANPADEAPYSPLVDAHSVRPEHVLAMLRSLGGRVGRVLVVGCEPARLDDATELSAPVAAALDDAVRLVRRVAADCTIARAHHASTMRTAQ